MIKKYGIYKLAAQQMIDENFVLFDTETTGFAAQDEIVEMGIIDCQGNVLYDGMFQPTQKMNPEASRVSGITDEMLEGKPLFKNEFPKIVAALDKAGVIAFNEPFDERMMYQTAQKYGLDTSVLDGIFQRAYCAQRLYDQYIGYNRTRLEFSCANEGIEKVQTHRATDDCVMTLALIKKVADRTTVPNYKRYCEIKAKATGKTVVEVSKPLGGPGQGKPSDGATLEYAKLFNEGMSVQEIAEVKQVQERTVMERLVSAYRIDAIQSIDFMVQPHYEGAIRAIIKLPGWNGRLTPVKEALPEDCTWDCIRAVVAKYKKEQSKTDLADVIAETEKLGAQKAASGSFAHRQEREGRD